MRRRAPLRFSIAKLQAVVGSVPVLEVLGSLVRAGAIEGYERRGWEVFVWGNAAAVGAALEHMDAGARRQEATRELRDGREEYYRTARAFVHTAAFRRLPPASREAWRLHSQGQSRTAISLRTGLPEHTVRALLRGARNLAGLPAATRPAITEPAPCDEQGCESTRRAKGLCWNHYQQARRRRSAGVGE